MHHFKVPQMLTSAQIVLCDAEIFFPNVQSDQSTVWPQRSTRITTRFSEKQAELLINKHVTLMFLLPFNVAKRPLILNFARFPPH